MCDRSSSREGLAQNSWRDSEIALKAMCSRRRICWRWAACLVFAQLPICIDGQRAAPSILCFRDDLPGVLLKPRFLPRGEPEMVVGDITPAALRARQLLDNLTASALTTGCSLSISGYSWGYGRVMVPGFTALWT